MKRIFCLLLVVLNFHLVEASTTIRIGTYNIWNPEFEQKYSGKTTWPQRLPNIIENIKNSKADVLLLQEVGVASYEDLVKDKIILQQYASFYIPHAPSKAGQKEGRDGLALFFNTDKLRDYHFVRSIDGKRETHRRDYYVDFEFQKNEQKIHFRIAGIHVDAGEDIEIGNRQLESFLKDIISNTADLDFIIVAGDFNEGAEEGERPRAKIMQITNLLQMAQLYRHVLKPLKSAIKVM